MKLLITIILCIKNGRAYLPDLFEKIGSQKGKFEIELLVCDSGSTDGSFEFVKSKKRKVKNIRQKVFRIKPEEFRHGKTRNMLVKKATGSIVVFLSQDIQIPNSWWLHHLLKPFQNKNIAGVFCRQKPNANANPFDKFFYSQTYPHKNRIIKNQNPKLGVNRIFFSMVCGATRKELIVKYPFVGNRDWAIDQWWAKTVLEKGLGIFYTADTFVFHSHDYSLGEIWQRNVLLGRSLLDFPKEGFFKISAEWALYVIREFWFGKLGVKKIGILPYELFRLIGFWWGGVTQ
jgi:rhamnosyltransferase